MSTDEDVHACSSARGAASSDTGRARLPLPPGAIDVRAALEAILDRDRAEVARLQASLDEERRAGHLSCIMAAFMVLVAGVAVHYFRDWHQPSPAAPP